MQKLKARFKSWIKNIPWIFVGAGFLSAALLVLSFPPYSVVALVFLGLAPLLIAAFRAQTYREAAYAGFTCMFFFIVLGLSWISFVATNFGGLPWIVGQLVLIAFASFAEPQYLVLALLAVALVRGSGARLTRHPLGSAAVFLIALPLAYVGLDVLYPKIFPITLGQALYHWFSVAQLAEYTGVYGLTVPILISNIAIAILIDGFWPARKKDHERKRHLPSPVFAVAALALVSIGLFGADQWGKKRIAQLDALESSFNRTFKFSIIQGNIGDVDKLASEKGFEPAVRHVLTTYREMSIESAKRFKPDLIIWPETSYPYLYTHMKDDRANRTGAARDQWIANVVQDTQSALYFGAYSNVAKRDFNTGFLVSPPYALSGLYRKSILLAFGEYIPLGPLSPIVQDLVPSIANFGRGQGPMVLELPTRNAGTVKLGPQICYEGIVPEFSRESARLGAEILFNITNDSWFGPGSEAELHLLLTVFRSIELRRPMIRGTNTGISLWIDSTGRMRGATRLFEPAFVEDEIRLPGEKQEGLPETFYFRYGALFGNACGIIALALLAAVFGPELMRRLRARRARR